MFLVMLPQAHDTTPLPTLTVGKRSNRNAPKSKTTSTWSAGNVLICRHDGCDTTVLRAPKQQCRHIPSAAQQHKHSHTHVSHSQQGHAPHVEVNDCSREHIRIKSVKHATMAWDQCSAVLDASVALHDTFNQISQH